MALHGGGGLVLVALVVDGHLSVLAGDDAHGAERAVLEDRLPVLDGEHRLAVGLKEGGRAVLLLGLHERRAPVGVEYEVLVVGLRVPVPHVGDRPVLQLDPFAVHDLPGALHVLEGKSGGRGRVVVPQVLGLQGAGVEDAEHVGAAAGEAERVGVLLDLLRVAGLGDGVGDDHLRAVAGDDARPGDGAVAEGGGARADGECGLPVGLPLAHVVVVVEAQAASVGVEDEVVLVVLDVLVPGVGHRPVLRLRAAAVHAQPRSADLVHRQVGGRAAGGRHHGGVVVVVAARGEREGQTEQGRQKQRKEGKSLVFLFHSMRCCWVSPARWVVLPLPFGRGGVVLRGAWRRTAASTDVAAKLRRGVRRRKFFHVFLLIPRPYGLFSNEFGFL